MLFYTNSLYSQNSDKITIGSIEKIYSKILKEERKIWIYNPGENNSDTTERYPVLYLLDAEEHFYSTVGMVKQMSGRWPKMIVVGITNTNRNRDLTPTLIGSDGSINANSGGVANFMSFVEKELNHGSSLFVSYGENSCYLLQFPVGQRNCLAVHSLMY